MNIKSKSKENDKKINDDDDLVQEKLDDDDLVQEKPDEDLVQEKPEDDNYEDNINSNNDNFFKSKEDSINNNSLNKNNSENKIDNLKVKESETLKDSYCDLIVKNLEKYRNISDSKKS